MILAVLSTCTLRIHATMSCCLRQTLSVSWPSSLTTSRSVGHEMTDTALTVFLWGHSSFIYNVFSVYLTSHSPRRNANNIEPYAFIIFFGKCYHPRLTELCNTGISPGVQLVVCCLDSQAFIMQTSFITFCPAIVIKLRNVCTSTVPYCTDVCIWVI